MKYKIHIEEMVKYDHEIIIDTKNTNVNELPSILNMIVIDNQNNSLEAIVDDLRFTGFEIIEVTEDCAGDLDGIEISDWYENE